jgi:hypothetical protein
VPWSLGDAGAAKAEWMRQEIEAACIEAREMMEP